jgi:DNA-binding LacI/PurR family transcriptional regulator
LPLDARLIVPNDEVRRNSMPYPMYASAVTRALLDLRPRPTAIVIGWTAMALGVLKEIGRQGLRCPEDIELVSYGDEHGFDTAGPGITSLDIRLASMGATAAETLFEEMEGRAEPGRKVLCPPRLRVRGSCPLEGFFELLAAWTKSAHLTEASAV